MASQHYKELKSAIGDLRRHLLPSKFNDEGIYKERVFTGVIAFRVLNHAAIEEYIEIRVSDIAINAASHCSKTRIISDPAAHIASFNDRSYGVPPATFNPIQNNQNKDWSEKIDLVSRVSKSAGSFVAFVKKDNHGIKEKNLTRLFLTIGLRHHDIDPVLVSELDSFGEARGEVAHSSVAKHVRKKPNPKDELVRVNQIVTLLKDLDKKLDTLASSIVYPA